MRVELEQALLGVLRVAMNLGAVEDGLELLETFGRLRVGEDQGCLGARLLVRPVSRLGRRRSCRAPLFPGRTHGLRLSPDIVRCRCGFRSRCRYDLGHRRGWLGNHDGLLRGRRCGRHGLDSRGRLDDRRWGCRGLLHWGCRGGSRGRHRRGGDRRCRGRHGRGGGRGGLLRQLRHNGISVLGAHAGRLRGRRLALCGRLHGLRDRRLVGRLQLALGLDHLEIQHRIAEPVLVPLAEQVPDVLLGEFVEVAAERLVQDVLRDGGDLLLVQQVLGGGIVAEDTVHENLAVQLGLPLVGRQHAGQLVVRARPGLLALRADRGFPEQLGQLGHTGEGFLGDIGTVGQPHPAFDPVLDQMVHRELGGEHETEAILAIERASHRDGVDVITPALPARLELLLDVRPGIPVRLVPGAQVRLGVRHEPGHGRHDLGLDAPLVVVPTFLELGLSKLIDLVAVPANLPNLKLCLGQVEPPDHDSRLTGGHQHIPRPERRAPGVFEHGPNPLGGCGERPQGPAVGRGRGSSAAPETRVHVHRRDLVGHRRGVADHSLELIDLEPGHVLHQPEGVDVHVVGAEDGPRADQHLLKLLGHADVGQCSRAAQLRGLLRHGLGGQRELTGPGVAFPALTERPGDSAFASHLGQFGLPRLGVRVDQGLLIRGNHVVDERQPGGLDLGFTGALVARLLLHQLQHLHHLRATVVRLVLVEAAVGQGAAEQDLRGERGGEEIEHQIGGVLDVHGRRAFKLQQFVQPVDAFLVLLLRDDLILRRGEDLLGLLRVLEQAIPALLGHAETVDRGHRDGERGEFRDGLLGRRDRALERRLETGLIALGAEQAMEEAARALFRELAEDLIIPGRFEEVRRGLEVDVVLRHVPCDPVSDAQILGDLLGQHGGLDFILGNEPGGRVADLGPDLFGQLPGTGDLGRDLAEAGQDIAAHEFRTTLDYI